MSRRKAQTVKALIGKPSGNVHTMARTLFDALPKKRVDIENALISAALGEGYDKERMLATSDLKLEWSMLESAVRYAEPHMELSQRQSCYILHINGCDEYHLPYSAYGIQIGKAIVRIHCP